MFQTVRRAFQIADIRKKILYTLMMLIVIRIGSELPTPGVDPDFIQDFFAQNTGEAFNFFNAITGGSFEQMSVLALSITPYITSSIIMQLLTIAIPKLEEMHKDGEDGRKKIAAITRYLTVVSYGSWIWTSGTSQRVQLCQCSYRCTDIDSRKCFPYVGR